ncbi:hypothetical protein [Phenylobacterium sp.]|jgi:hypothetical protein|uniref:hypothetical protein n=1 Tax=Phenylobacterium sp. TaxID=1871053 RepID=UPI002F4005D0
MASIAIALALFLQGQPAAEAQAAPPPEAAEEPRLPAGAPKDDYQFVGWCYGMLRGYLDLHDQVMPEVTRIESEFRPPDRKLSDDLKVYADMQKEGRAQLKLFQSALTAAEKASLKPINTLGAQAVSKGADVWRAAPDVTPARLAQEWMSWALPGRCEVTAKALKANATLLGGAFKVNAEDDTPAEPAPAAGADAKPAEAAPPEAAHAEAATSDPAPAAASPEAPPPADPAADPKPAADPAAVMLEPSTPPAKTKAKKKPKPQ